MEAIQIDCNHLVAIYLCYYVFYLLRKSERFYFKFLLTTKVSNTNAKKVNCSPIFDNLSSHSFAKVKIIELNYRIILSYYL